MVWPLLAVFAKGAVAVGKGAAVAGKAVGKGVAAGAKSKIGSTKELVSAGKFGEAAKGLSMGGGGDASSGGAPESGAQLTSGVPFKLDGGFYGHPVAKGQKTVKTVVQGISTSRDKHSQAGITGRAGHPSIPSIVKNAPRQVSQRGQDSFASRTPKNRQKIG